MSIFAWGILGGVIIVLVIVVVGFVLMRMLRSEIKLSQDQFLQVSQQLFSAERSKSENEMEMRKQAVENSVQGLKAELESYKKLIHEFEQDRAIKYGNVENELKNTAQTTLRLQETTNRLNNILGNVKLRGQWGERMAEDIIRYAGLVEGVNYIKQKKLETVSTKPDYTFFLPDNHKVNMDVKFPLDNYMHMVNAKEETESQNYEKEFIKNVKERIKEIQNRDYINCEENTLDFVLLFIPNEQVYAIIQEKMPDLMDSALSQKVLLCSPFTLYAMLSIIRQAHENFRYEKDIKKIIQKIEQFVKIYETFKSRFDAMSATIQKLDDQYQDIKNKSFKNLDVKIRQIEDYKKGQGLSLENNRDVIEIGLEETGNDESFQ